MSHGKSIDASTNPAHPFCVDAAIELIQLVLDRGINVKQVSIRMARQRDAHVFSLHRSSSTPSAILRSTRIRFARAIPKSKSRCRKRPILCFPSSRRRVSAPKWFVIRSCKLGASTSSTMRKHRSPTGQVILVVRSNDLRAMCLLRSY